MANLAGVPQSRFFPAKLEAEGDDAIFNTLLGPGGRSIGFFAHEIDAWLETQAAEREHAVCLARQRAKS